MMLRSYRLPIVATRWWVRLYTTGLPAEVKLARRHEVEADLFDSEQDAPHVLEATYCLLGGAADDLRWRVSRFEPTVALIQGVLISTIAGALTAFLLGCFVVAIGLSLFLAALPGLFTAAFVGWLLTRGEREEVMQMTTVSGSARGFYEQTSAVGLAIAPIVMLAGMLMIGIDDRPQNKESEIVDLAAAHPARFAAGYVLYALALSVVVAGLVHFCGVLRDRGVRLLGTLAPVLLVVATPVVIVAGMGALGLAVALVSEAGLSAREYFVYVFEETVIAVLSTGASAVLGIGLLLVGIGVWRSRVITGPVGVAVSIAFALFGVAFAPHGGWVVTTESLSVPVFAGIALWPIAWKQLGFGFENTARSGPSVPARSDA